MPKIPILLDRFWSKVNKNGPIHPTLGTPCWIWIAGKFKDGYGQFHGVEGEHRSHRASWIIHRGEIPNRLQVLHKCDMPLCVNPTHLFLGTHQDNMDDMKAKGRQRYISGDAHYSRVTPEKMSRGEKHSQIMLPIVKKGEECYNVILTEEIVRWCRIRYAQGGISITEISAMFGVTRMPMWQAIRGQTWKHLN